MGFSRVPLCVATYLGVTASAFSIVLTGWAIYQRFVDNDAVRGWASTLVVILPLGGAQLLRIAIVGEYVSCVYDEVKQRPIHVFGELRGFEDQPDYLAQGRGGRLRRFHPEPSFDR